MKQGNEKDRIQRTDDRKFHDHNAKTPVTDLLTAECC
jgi:hypothetical protein